MSLEQAASFGEASAAQSKRGEIFAAVESLDRGIAIIEKHLQAAHSSGGRGGTDVEKTELRARLFDFLARKAELLLSSGGTSAALSTALYMCSTDPRNAAGFLFAGQALRKLQRFDQAVDYLTTAQKLDPASAQIKQCLELAMTELRLPSTLRTSAADGGSTGAADDDALTISVGGVQVPLDVDGILKLMRNYVPSAKAIVKTAKQKPVHALGVVAVVLLLLALVLTLSFLLFCVCVGAVSALHRWERRRVASSSSCSGCGGSYRVPVIDVPLSVLTSAFLSVSAVYLLLL